MRPQPIMLEERQPERHVPRRGGLGEGVRLARQARQPVHKHPVESLAVNQRGPLHRGADGGVDLHAQRPSAFGAVFDRLRQGDPFG